jgi:hypothetical protein
VEREGTKGSVICALREPLGTTSHFHHTTGIVAESSIQVLGELLPTLPNPKMSKVRLGGHPESGASDLRVTSDPDFWGVS